MLQAELHGECLGAVSAGAIGEGKMAHLSVGSRSSCRGGVKILGPRWSKGKIIEKCTVANLPVRMQGVPSEMLR